MVHFRTFAKDHVYILGTSIVVETMKVTKASGMNILGIVVFSLFLGGVLSKMGADGAPLVKFFECLHVATMKLVTLVIWCVPLASFPSFFFADLF